MPLTPEERKLIEDIKEHHVPPEAPAVDIVMRLVAIIDRITPMTFNVGERVQAINYKGERLGRGRVTASQRENGFYMKVRLDTGGEVVVPQATSKRLVLKK